MHHHSRKPCGRLQEAEARSDIELDVDAVVDDQEQVGIVRYWEGAIAVRVPGAPEVIGRGYLELTGY